MSKAKTLCSSFSFQVVAFVLEAFFAEMELETSEKCEDTETQVSLFSSFELLYQSGNCRYHKIVFIS